MPNIAYCPLCGSTHTQAQVLTAVYQWTPEHEWKAWRQQQTQNKGK